MSISDTHIHLYAEEYSTDRDALIAAAHQAGIDRFLLPNIDKDSIDGMVALCTQWPENIQPMFGLHPCSVKEDFESQLEFIRNAYEKHKRNTVAIGEIGLDFYWDLTYKKEQELAFRKQVKWALEENLPIVIHSRNSTNELIEILKEINNPQLKGVFHCFSGDLAQANEIMGLGFHLGIGGVITFKNSGLDKVVPHLPLDRIVLETDGPYLAPVPHRGKRNEPAYLKLIAEKVAALKEITFEELTNITTYNASKLFKKNHNDIQ